MKTLNNFKKIIFINCCAIFYVIGFTSNSILAGIYLNEDYISLFSASSDGFLYAGMNSRGKQDADFIVKWNGSKWVQLGSGMDGYVYALAIGNDGSVYAGGQFDQVGGKTVNGVAKWNGSVWSGLGEGLGDPNGLVSVDHMAIGKDGSLYVGGWFATAGGKIVNNIAKWNGATWSSLGEGIEKSVTALTIAPSGDLYVAVGGKTVAKWNGSAWSTLGKEMNDSINALAVDNNGAVYAGGFFTVAGGVKANYVAKWNGSTWSSLGSGMDNCCVSHLAVASDGTLFAKGGFTKVGGVNVNRHAKWNGSAWSIIDGGVNHFAVSSDGTLYVFGKFSFPNIKSSVRVAKWNGSSLTPIGNVRK